MSSVSWPDDGRLFIEVDAAIVRRRANDLPTVKVRWFDDPERAVTGSCRRGEDRLLFALAILTAPGGIAASVDWIRRLLDRIL